MFIAKRKEQRIDRNNRRQIEMTVDELLEPSNKWTELELKVQNEIKAARLELAKDFRPLIGVE